MGSYEVPNCTTCSFKEVFEESVVWCVVCLEGFCSACQRHHLVSRCTRNHSFIPINDRKNIPDIVHDISKTCPDHDRKFDGYCSDHQQPCCVKCITNNHKTCANVSPFEDITANVKTSVALTQIEENMASLISKLEMTTKDKRASKQLFSEEAEQLKVKLEELSRHLQEKLTCLKEQIDKNKIQHDERVDLAISKSSEMLSHMQGLKTKMSLLKENGSNEQIFLCLKRFEIIIGEHEKQFSTALENGVFDCVELSLQIPEKKNIDIGNIQLIGKPWKLPHGTVSQNAVVAKVQKPPSDEYIDKIRLVKAKEIAFPRGFLTSCVVLHNDMMIFACFDNSVLRLLDHNCGFLRDIPVQMGPQDIAIINRFTIAVSHPLLNKIALIELKNYEIIQEIKYEGECIDLGYCDNRLFVSIKGYGIQILGLIKSFGKHTMSFSNAPAMYVTQSKVFFVDEYEPSLKCKDYNEQKGIWTTKFPYKVHNYSKMTTDCHGNIYITSYNNKSLLVVSADGKHIRTILTESDGLYKVTGLCFNETTNQLIVITDCISKVVVYNVQT